jgi:putative inorganic carbon (HCO3(-)) transporter
MATSLPAVSALSPARAGRVAPPAAAAIAGDTAARLLAYRLYLIFVAAWFVHFSERNAILGMMRLDFLMVVGISGLIIITRADGPKSLLSPISKLIAVIAVYAVVTIPLVEWPGSVLNTGLINFVKAFVFYFFTVQLITTEQRLRQLLTVFVLGQTFRVFEPLYLNLTEGYWGSFTTMMGGDGLEFMNRLAGSPYDVINANGLALVIITVVPFLHYLGPLSRGGRLLYMAFIPLGGYALMLTASRSGLLGLAMTLVLMWWNSKRKAIFGTILIIGALIGLQTASADLYDRYLSIFSSQTKNAATAGGRISGVYADFEVSLRRPLFGHGLGTSMEANANFGHSGMVSHNLFTEVAQELGFIGLALFLLFLATVTITVSTTVRTLKARGDTDSFRSRLSLALQAWLWMNLLFAFASYGLSSYEWYFIAGVSEVLSRLALNTGPQAQSAVVPVTVSGNGEVYVHPMLRPRQLPGRLHER